MPAAGRFQCEICGTEFKSWQDIADHQSATHYDGVYRCQSCGAFFADREKLGAHRKAEHGNEGQTPAPVGRNGSEDENEDLQSMLLKRQAEQHKARKKTRGPYRKSSVSR